MWTDNDIYNLYYYDLEDKRKIAYRKIKIAHYNQFLCYALLDQEEEFQNNKEI